MNPEQLETLRLGGELIGGAVIGVLSYFLKSIIADFKARHDAHDAVARGHGDRLAQLDKHVDGVGAHAAQQLADFKLHAAENFTTKGELSRVVEQFTRSNQAVFEKLERIEDKLDKKADKQHPVFTP